MIFKLHRSFMKWYLCDTQTLTIGLCFGFCQHASIIRVNCGQHEYVIKKILLERLLLKMNALHVCPILTVRHEGDVARASDVDHLVSLELLPVGRIANRE